jgi:hypothetical protein
MISEHLVSVPITTQVDFNWDMLMSGLEIIAESLDPMEVKPKHVERIFRIYTTLHDKYIVKSEAKYDPR